MSEERKMQLYHLDVIMSEESMKRIEGTCERELTRLIGDKEKFLDIVARGFLIYKKAIHKLLKPAVKEMLDDMSLRLEVNSWDDD